MRVLQQTNMNYIKRSLSTSAYTNKLLVLFICLLLFGCTKAQDTATQEQNTSNNAEEVVYQNDYIEEITPTQTQRYKQQRQSLDFYKQNKSVDRNAMFAFQIQSTYEQFHFHLPTNHNIYFLARVYVLKDNVYSQVNNIQEQPAVHAVIYENNHKIVEEKTFFFQSVMKVQGKAGFTYMIRFYSPTHKLLVITHNNFVQSSHFEGRIQSDDMQIKQRRLETVKNKLFQYFKTLRTTHHIQFEQRYKLTQKLRKFATFQIAEMLVVIGVCFFQIKVISRLFKTQSII